MRLFPSFLSPLNRLEAKKLAALALPIIVTQLSVTGMGLIDVLLAGHMGVHILASVAIGTSIWGLTWGALQGVMMAVPTSVAYLEGADRRADIWSLFRQSLWLAVIAGVAMPLLTTAIAPHLLRLMGVAPDLANDAIRFLYAIGIGAPGLAIFLACRGFSEGLGIARPSLWFGLFGLALLGPVAYVLMYGRFGLPALGVVGSGLATALVYWIQAVTFVVYIRRHPHYRNLGRERIGRGPQWSSILELLRIGLPMSAALLMEVGLFIATALVIGRLGDVAVATHQIALSAASIAFMLPWGLSMAITVRVASARGRGDTAGLFRAAYLGIGATLVLQIVSCIVMLTLSGLIVRAYTRDPVIQAGAIALVHMAGLFQLSDGLQVAANGALRGLKDTRVPMFMTFFAYWLVGMPAGSWLSLKQGLGAPGMWMGLLVGLSTAAVLLLSRFFIVSRREQGMARSASPPLRAV